ncbi:YgaP family membrane protein [Paragemmobacter straminiformis]|uniref:DUF2892 domain-containing protein n=1 Tax=Paragemmobacter straminiformis TaxID=2045119 RepID=A0A842I6Z0_9RHOB|nr:DUF2892 domain-containing protein [Gemmobacter straminiformis]MBC2835620.1 DUF2892 domain-containing protein [Gemmobacter straminiformis]
MLKTNVGPLDRTLRVILGLVLLGAFFFGKGEGPWHYALLIGVVPLATAAVSNCPLYSVLGLSTCPVKRG